MRVVMLSAYDHSGGGSIAALRLHRALRAIGVESFMLVQGASSGEDGVLPPASRAGRLAALLRPDLDQIAVRGYPRRGLFSPAWLPDRVLARVHALRPDVVNVHWINGGFLRPESLRRLQVPLVWTMHDMWAFTGGCHYDEACGRYRTQCGNCPVLGSRRAADLAARGQWRKRRAYAGLDLSIVAPSSWMAQCVTASALLGAFPVSVLANALDLARFRPLDARLARRAFDLPEDARIVLFGAASASDARKGFVLLQQALRMLPAHLPDGAREVLLVVFGAWSGEEEAQFGIRTRHVGRLRDEVSMALLYNAADVFVVPSLQDNLPNTLAEALACGTPCVGFGVGGIPDLIEHKGNGYLSRAFEPEDLARGIAWVLDPQVQPGLRIAARATAQRRLEAEAVAHAHLRLFEEVRARARAQGKGPHGRSGAGEMQVEVRE